MRKVANVKVRVEVYPLSRLISRDLRSSTDGIEFRTSALRKHRDTARAQALKAAREKATAMAAELGSKVGKPLSITESASSFGMRSWGGGSRGGGMQQNSFSGGGGSSESTEGFAPGQIAVSAAVNVTS